MMSENETVPAPPEADEPEYDADYTGPVEPDYDAEEILAQETTEDEDDA